ncbi:MAG: hypothetical protein R3F37_23030 [Candidatus Competibacteraceae bacterium]
MNRSTQPEIQAKGMIKSLFISRNEKTAIRSFSEPFGAIPNQQGFIASQTAFK